MADYITNTSELTSIANAIRTKGGTSENLTYPGGFIQAISDIVTGGGESEGGWEDISNDFIYTPLENPGVNYPLIAISNGTYGFLFAQEQSDTMAIVAPSYVTDPITRNGGDVCCIYMVGYGTNGSTYGSTEGYFEESIFANTDIHYYETTSDRGWVVYPYGDTNVHYIYIAFFGISSSYTQSE